MEWNIRNDLPIYAQLVEQMKQAIASGAFAPGQRLASVRDLAAEAGVNPNTMQRALQELERQGMVFSQRTAGRFVTEDAAVIEEAKRGLARERTRDFLGAMAALGYSGAELLALLSENMEEEEHGRDS